MRKIGIILLLMLSFSSAHAVRIGGESFDDSAILINFSDVQFTDPNSGNGALTPILDYEDLGVVFHVHNQENFVGTIHDEFRLGGFADQGLSIATNVGDDASIEL